MTNVGGTPRNEKGESPASVQVHLRATGGGEVTPTARAEGQRSKPGGSSSKGFDPPLVARKSAGPLQTVSSLRIRSDLPLVLFLPLASVDRSVDL